MALTAVEHAKVIKVTGTAASAEKVTDSSAMIQAITWYGATTDAHKLSVTDKAGNQIWKAQMATTALTENISIAFPIGILAQDGIYIDDLDSGEVYIYLA